MRNTFIGSPVERREDLRFVRGRGAICRRSQPRRPALRGHSAQLGRAWPHSLDRRGGGVADPGRARGHHRARHAGRPAADPDAAAAAAGVQAVRAAGDRRTTRCAMSASRSRSCSPTAWRSARMRSSRSPSTSSRCRRSPDCAAAAQGDRAAVRGAGHQPRDDLHRRLRRRRRGVRARPPMSGARASAPSATTASPWSRAACSRSGTRAAGRLTVSGAAKVPFFNRRILAKQIGLPEDAIDMVENDVGGGFGARGEFYPEDFLIPFAARQVGRPVKWIEDRRENLMAMNHAREAEVDVEIACTRDGMILGLRGHADVDMGAYMRTNGAVGARNIAQFMSGPYRIPNINIDVVAVDDQQDAGRHLSRAGPLRDRFLPRAAARHGGGRSRHRPRRVPPPQSHSGDGDAVSVRRPSRRSSRRTRSTAATIRSRSTAASPRFGWAEKSKLQGQLIDGRYHGLAVGCFIEGGAAGPKETARLEIDADGAVAVFMGSSAVGQGVETVFAQIAADALEMPMERIAGVFHGSTAYVSDGYGAYHSRSVVMGGSALLDAVKNLHEAHSGDGGAALGLRAGRGQDRRGQRSADPDGRRATFAAFAGLSGRGHLPQQEAHLHLRRPCRPCDGRRPHRRGRDRRLSSRSRIAAASSIR